MQSTAAEKWFTHSPRSAPFCVHCKQLCLHVHACPRSKVHYIQKTETTYLNICSETFNGNSTRQSLFRWTAMSLWNWCLIFQRLSVSVIRDCCEIVTFITWIPDYGDRVPETFDTDYTVIVFSINEYFTVTIWSSYMNLHERKLVLIT